MGKAERPSTITNAFYSARLVWRVVQRTRVLVSVLKTEKTVRKKVSFQSVHSIENDAGGEGTENGYGIFREQNCLAIAPRLKRRRYMPRSRDTCYLCKLRYKRIDDFESPWPWPSDENTPSDRNMVYLPISRSQPPNPPHRSSSLPYFKQLRRMQLAPHPSAPLSSFQLSQRDGATFQYFVRVCTDRHSLHEFMDPIWDLLLQVCDVESCVRHLAIGISSIQQSRHFEPATCRDSCGSSHLQHAFKHYFHAIQIIQQRLHRIKKRADSLTWELSFMICYLAATLQLSIGSQEAVYFWLRSGYTVLKRAFYSFRPTLDGLGLPASMVDVALAFGRLNIPAKRRRGLG